MPKPDDAPVVEDDTTTTTPDAAPSLDQVHAASQAKVEAEDAEAEEDDTTTGGDEDTTDDDSADDTTGDDTADGDDSDDDNSDDDSVDDDAAAADETEDDDTTAPEPVVPDPTTTTEVDTDITKKVDGKIAIRDSEGTTFYFNNLEEVPDTFEPLSYKELMVGTKALLAKEQEDAKAAAAAEDAKVVAEQQKASDDLQKAWENDASALVRAGKLPDEPKKLEAAKEEVYKYIEDEMKKGNIITSFAQAYKSLQYDKQQEANAKKQKELNDAKKKRGAMVQGGGGGGGASNPRTTKVIEAPPAGVGLDAVHNRAINSL